MSEKTQQENVIPLSRAKSFSNSSAKAFSSMSTLQKVLKRGDSRTTKQGQRGRHIGPKELRSSLSQMSLLDNHPSKGSPRDRVAKTVVVDSILADLQITLDVHQSNGITDVVPGLLLAMEVIGDEYK